MAIPKKTVTKKTLKPPTKKTVAKKTPSPATKTEEKSIYEICSISALSRKFLLDRGTVSTRLNNAGIAAHKQNGNEKLFELTEKVRKLLEKDEKEAAQIKKLHLEGTLLETKLGKELGEFFSKKEVTELFLTMFGKLHKKTCIEFPSKNSKKLHEANSSADVANLLRGGLSEIFQELRDETEKFLPNEKAEKAKK